MAPRSTDGNGLPPRYTDDAPEGAQPADAAHLVRLATAYGDRLLPPAANARIASSLADASSSGRGFSWLTFPVTAVALSAVAFFIWNRAPQPGTTHVSLASCDVRHLDLGNGAHAALVGPAEAESGASFVSLHLGKIDVSSGDREIAIESSGIKLKVHPHSLIELDVSSTHVRVAAFSGAVNAIWSDARQVEIPAGTVMYAQGSAVLTESPQPIERLLAGDDSARICAGEFGATPAIPPTAIAPAPAVVPPPVEAPSGDDIQTPTLAPRHKRAEVKDDSDSGSESRLLADALAVLRDPAHAGEALTLLDRHDAQYPKGTLAQEALVARVQALSILDRKAELLAVLETHPLEHMRKANELMTLRGELRAKSGRCREALGDFTRVFGREPAGRLAERALYGRASCWSTLGEDARAREDLASYLEQFPAGSFAQAAHKALGK